MQCLKMSKKKKSTSNTAHIKKQEQIFQCLPIATNDVMLLLVVNPHNGLNVTGSVFI